MTSKASTRAPPLLATEDATHMGSCFFGRRWIGQASRELKSIGPDCSAMWASIHGRTGVRTIILKSMTGQGSITNLQSYQPVWDTNKQAADATEHDLLPVEASSPAFLLRNEEPVTEAEMKTIADMLPVQKRGLDYTAYTWTTADLYKMQGPSAARITHAPYKPPPGQGSETSVPRALSQMPVSQVTTFTSFFGWSPTPVYVGPNKDSLLVKFSQPRSWGATALLVLPKSDDASVIDYTDVGITHDVHGRGVTFTTNQGAGAFRCTDQQDVTGEQLTEYLTGEDIKKFRWWRVLVTRSGKDPSVQS